MKISSLCHKHSFVLLICSVGTSPPLGHPNKRASFPCLPYGWNFRPYTLYVLASLTLTRSRLCAILSPRSGHGGRVGKEVHSRIAEFYRARTTNRSRNDSTRLKTTSGGPLWRRVSCISNPPRLCPPAAGIIRNFCLFCEKPADCPWRLWF